MPLFNEQRGKHGIEFTDWAPPPFSFEEPKPIGTDRQTFIYAFACEGFYKIGQARNPKSRLSQVQTGCPLDLRMVCAVWVSALGSTYAESYVMHHMGKHVRGEWFSSEGKDDAEVRRIIARSRARSFAYARHYRRAWREVLARDANDWQTDEITEKNQCEVLP